MNKNTQKWFVRILAGLLAVITVVSVVMPVLG